MDIHNYQRRFERTVDRVKILEDISKENKKIILNFKDYCLSEGIGVAKIERYLGDMIKLSRMLNKSFPKASKEDIRKVLGDLNQGILSEETKKCFKIMLRKLYRFIEGIEERGVYPERVKWISINIANNHKKLPEELLNEEEIKSIIKHCKTTRDKALISVLAESGCRVGEIGSMKVKHVSFEEYGARLHVQGKTGMRKILVIWSCPYLQSWINNHETNDDPESYLWTKEKGKLLGYPRISAILKDASKRAGIKKRIYLHLLRHSSASKNSLIMSEAAMKQYYGWTQGSKMAGVYIHLSGKETDEAILRANGIEIEKKKAKQLMKPRSCLRCKTLNEVTNRFCRVCGLPLDQEEASKIIESDLKRIQADEVMNRLINDPEILELIKKKIT